MYRKLLVGLSVVFLSACGTLGAGYTHNSSAEDYIDKNETNMFGPYYKVYLCKVPSDYCTELKVALQWEIGEEVYGRNPVGNITIDQPLFVIKKKTNTFGPEDLP